MQRFSSFYHERKSTVREETATIHTCAPPFVTTRGSEGHIPGRSFQEPPRLCQRGPGGEGMMERFMLPPRHVGPIRNTWSDRDRKEERRVLRLGSPGIYSRNAVALVLARDRGCCSSSIGDTMEYWISSTGCDLRCASKPGDATRLMLQLTDKLNNASKTQTSTQFSTCARL